MAKKKVTRKKAATRPVALNRDQFALVRNEMLTLTREALNRMLTVQSDIDQACNYPTTLDKSDYKTLYDRMGLARRAVEIWPDECWQKAPRVYEEEKADLTDFEKDWNELEERLSLYNSLHRIDVLSGIGSFGVILLGLDDGKNLDKSVEGVDDKTGEPTGAVSYKLNYLRTFDESVLTVDAIEQNPTSPRYGKPQMYSIQFTDIGGQNVNQKVHWTRILHIADNRLNSETYGVSRLQSIYNNLQDVKKISGGSAEMFWKGGFPGYAFELPIEAMEYGGTLDTASIKEQLKDYFDGLQRYIGLEGGVTTKSLSQQVADPTGHAEIHLKLIALSLGVPYRVLLGSEEAKLASVQDKRTWNCRIARRQHSYLTPMVVRPFVDRLVLLGVLSKPKQYFVEWPDLNASTEDDIAKVALNRTDALAKYVQGNVHMLIPPREYLTGIQKISEAEAENILKEAEKFEKEMEPEPEPAKPEPIPRQTKPQKTSV